MSKSEQILKLRKITVQNGATENEEKIAKVIMYKFQNTSKEYVDNRILKHQNKERLCYCCDTLQESEDEIHKLIIDKSRGYGSNFDECNVEIQLCPHCHKEEYDSWFNEQSIVVDKYYEEYIYEDNITNLINSFILENQEYVWNHMDRYGVERQDWLDMKTSILPDEKYKEYGMYSPSEIKSYVERFPTCQHPINVVYNDGSKGCSCPFGALGHYGQEADINISMECHNCEHYNQRHTEGMDMNDEIYKLYESILLGEVALDKLEKAK